MTPETTKRLKTLLYEQEGFRQYPYKDTTGHLTIGIGRNLQDRGVSTDEALTMLENDIHFFSNKLSTNLPFFDSLDDIRKVVLVDMCFNLGLNGFLEFKNMLNAVAHKNWEMASFHIVKSKAFSQAPNRYQKLATMMKTGEFNDQ